MALTTTGELYCWGKGDSGQLGHGGKENLAVPRVVGGIEGPAVGRVLIFGGKRPFTASGGLGLGAGVEEALTPTAINGITMGEEDEGTERKE
jgi:hypothetical protein